MELVNMAGYKTKIRSELGSYLASAAIYVPAEVGIGARQGTHMIALVGDLSQPASAGKLQHIMTKLCTG